MICVNILPAEVNESVGWCWWCCDTVPAKLPRHTVFDLYFSKSGWILWSTWPKEHHLADSRAGRIIKSWFYRSLIHYPKEIQCYFVNHQSHSKIFLLEFQSEKILNNLKNWPWISLFVLVCSCRSWSPGSEPVWMLPSVIWSRNN